MASTSERLKQIIQIRNIRQSEIVEHTGINKGALSCYISGRYLPKQDNIYKLAKFLEVNPAWLMGLDVPMEPVISQQAIDNLSDKFKPIVEIGKKLRQSLGYYDDYDNEDDLLKSLYALIDSNPREMMEFLEFYKAFMNLPKSKQDAIRSLLELPLSDS